jgi:sialate O-acetylesterase
MVLQRGKPIALFGTGTPGRTVAATLSSSVDGGPIRLSRTSTTDSASAIGTIGDNGSWLVTLPPLHAGGPYSLTISDDSGVKLRYLNVMVGEVWIASGQSNMEFELHNDSNAKSTIAGSADPLLRFFNVPKCGIVDDDLIRAENSSTWRICTPDSCGTMSAVAYYFARKLRRDLTEDIPVGIVDCYIGGTSITCWISERMLVGTKVGRGYLARYRRQIEGKTDADCRAEADAWQHRFDAWNTAIAAAQAINPDITWGTLNDRYGECPWPPPTTPFSQYHVTGAFNAMISRLAPYSARGVLWYQGEEDERHYAEYRELLGCLIHEWRLLWKARSTDDFSDTYDTTVSDTNAVNANASDANADANTYGTGANAVTAPTGVMPDERFYGMPFIIVQLPRWIDQREYEAGIDHLRWPHLREAQADAAHTITGVHLEVTFDTGEFNNIHPTNKRPVGERAALQAEAHVYGLPVASDGPVFDSLRQDRGDSPASLRIRFRNADGLHFGHWDGDDVPCHRQSTTGTISEETASITALAVGAPPASGDADPGLLHEKPVPTLDHCADRHIVDQHSVDQHSVDQHSVDHRDASVSGFEIAGPDDVYRRANARIDGDAVVLSATEVPDPRAARYGWFSWGPAPLRNGSGLPAEPFRTSPIPNQPSRI